MNEVLVDLRENMEAINVPEESIKTILKYHDVREPAYNNDTVSEVIMLVIAQMPNEDACAIVTDLALYFEGSARQREIAEQIVAGTYADKDTLTKVIDVPSIGRQHRMIFVLGMTINYNEQFGTEYLMMLPGDASKGEINESTGLIIHEVLTSMDDFVNLAKDDFDGELGHTAAYCKENNLGAFFMKVETEEDKNILAELLPPELYAAMADRDFTIIEIRPLDDDFTPEEILSSRPIELCRASNVEVIPEPEATTEPVVEPSAEPEA